MSINALKNKKEQYDLLTKDLAKLEKEIKTIESQEVTKSVFSMMDDTIKVIYYNTCIVEFNDSKIVLNKGGYATPSTKRHMNEVSAAYDLGFEIITEKNVWEVTHKGKIITYPENTLILDR